MKSSAARYLLAAAFATAAALTAAAGAGNTLLVLQIGSDWCESGDDVRKTFESRAFRKALGNNVDFEVYDDMDDPTPAAKQANKKCARFRVETQRFPAITCLTRAPRRFFAQLENIPFDISPKELAAQVQAAFKTRDAAQRLFFDAKRCRDADKAASMYGRAFAMLEGQAGDFCKKSLREGELAFRDEWSALCRLDEKDRYGWKFRFETGAGVQLVEKATKFRTDEDFTGGRNFIASLRAIPTNALDTLQRQCVEIADYALWRKDESRLDENKAILRRALAMGRDTLWGQCALGYLILHGEQFEKRERPRLTPRPRPQAQPKPGKRPASPIKKLEERILALGPGAKFTEADKRTIAQYAVLRRIGRTGWEDLNERPGSKPFVRAFFGDRKWLEDFAWSGGCGYWYGAVLALESAVWQDAGRWIGDGDGTGRRFATALALTHPERQEDWIADLLDAYRSTALGKRLHKYAKTQPVWQWRTAIQHTAGHCHPASCERGFDYMGEVADQQRFFDKFCNMPFAKYAHAYRYIPWRNDNCFGEWVQREFYYESWRAADEWILRRYTPDIGGVCGELSKFGTGCANAHGLPAAPVGQPGHCAMMRRLRDGKWEVTYYITPPTGFSCTLMPFADAGKYTYCEAHEATFEGDREKRHDADRFLEAAFLAEERGRPPEAVAALYAAACKAWPRHCIAWRLRAEWIERANRPFAESKAFADDCAKTLKGWRDPLWDILAIHFGIAAKGGKDALAAELVRMMPALRQCGEPIQEEGLFDKALAKWTKPLKGDKAALAKVAAAAAKAQDGTSAYAAQVEKWRKGDD